MKKMTEEQLTLLAKLRAEGKTWDEIRPSFSGYTSNALRKTFYRNIEKPEVRAVVEKAKPKILLLDIETAPLLGYVWGLWDNNVALNQIHSDWYILSWSAKWLDAPDTDIMYEDQRKSKNLEDDSKLLQGIWKLLDEADIVVGQNSKSFDIKKLNARFILNGFKPPSSYRQVDTMLLAKARFGFTSNKLEYMTSKLCTKYKKLDHAKYSGFKLWSECLKGNQEAFAEMQEYNEMDVLSLQELYLKLRPWDLRTPNVNAFHDSEEISCACGSVEFRKNGFVTSNTGRFQRYTCKKCGAETRDKTNLLSKEKRKSLRSN